MLENASVILHLRRAFLETPKDTSDPQLRRTKLIKITSILFRDYSDFGDALINLKKCNLPATKGTNIFLRF